MWRSGNSQDLKQEGFLIRVRIPLHVYFSYGKPRSFTFKCTLHWAGNRRLITGVGSNPTFVTFPYLANRCNLLFCASSRCTFVPLIPFLQLAHNLLKNKYQIFSKYSSRPTTITSNLLEVEMNICIIVYLAFE